MRYFFLSDRNGKIHLAIAVIVIAAAFAFSISAGEWCLVLLCTALVMATEMLNCALEKLCDKVQPDFHPVIKIVKDVSAAAVLFESVISIVIGLIIFLPKILVLL